MSSPGGILRNRSGNNSKKGPGAIGKEASLDAIVSEARKNSKGEKSEWDYNLAFAIITVLGFATRFWGISHPNEVVFDEVHFGKFASYVSQAVLNAWRMHMPFHPPWPYFNTLYLAITVRAF